MKRILTLILSLAAFISLAGCTSAENTQTTEDVAGLAFVGQWKAKTVSGVFGESETYEISVIELNADGTGSYKGKTLVWQYCRSEQIIQVTLTKENTSAAFQIQQQDDGETVLQFFQDTYYRAADFEQ